jgi:A/G-specific adenine glycosylase
MSSELSQALLAWYEKHGRDLPWRRNRDPYAIWISEVMLQQTRAQTVVPFFQRWMESFPTIEAVAVAEREQVLAHWEGLGYYRRAHNLHQAAQRVMSEHGGELPSDEAALERLPGIGRYTAAAIAAFAFDFDTLALDGNLRRVLSRLIDLEIDTRTQGGEKRLREAGLTILPKGRAADFNQAMMDLGALVCVPVEPSCSKCPIEAHCLASERGVQEQRPVRRPKARIPHYMVAAAVLRRDGKVLIGRRPEGKLLGGLWEFPGGRMEPGESLEVCLRREMIEELGVETQMLAQLGSYDHAYTHFRVTVVAFESRLVRGEPSALEHTEIRWEDVDRLGQYPMGKVDRSIAKDLALTRPDVQVPGGSTE